MTKSVQMSGGAVGSAGALYLLMGIGTAFGMGYVDPLLRASNDGAVTANTLRSSTGLILAGGASSALGLVAMLALASVLYGLFEHVNRGHARLLVIFVIVGVAIWLANLTNLLVAIPLARGEGPSLAIEPAQRYGLMMLFLYAYRCGGAVATFFWGLWLLPFGLLLLRCGFAPKVLGVLMVVGGFPYLVHSATVLFAPDFAAVTARGLLLPTVAEVWTIGWLIREGMRRRRERVS